MRIETASEEDFAFGLEPCAPPVVAVTVLGGLAIRVVFADGVEGDVIFLRSHLTGVFESLKDEKIFAQACIVQGAVTWPGELDLAPDAMYDAIKKNGIWVLQ